MYEDRHNYIESNFIVREAKLAEKSTVLPCFRRNTTTAALVDLYGDNKITKTATYSHSLTNLVHT